MTIKYTTILKLKVPQTSTNGVTSTIPNGVLKLHQATDPMEKKNLGRTGSVRGQFSSGIYDLYVCRFVSLPCLNKLLVYKSDREKNTAKIVSSIFFLFFLYEE